VSKKFLADSKGFDLAIGDEVTITECRPMSKNKHFRITEILKAAPRLSILKEEAGLDAVLHRKTSETAGKDASANESSHS